MSSSLVFYGQFTASGQGATGLTVTLDITRITRSDGTQTASVTGGSATEVTTPNARGLYLYRLAGADLSLYDYVATFITSGTADLKHVPALWSRFGDSALSEAMTEPTAVPAVTASLKDALEWLFVLARNKVTQTATEQKVRNDADAADIGSAAVSDDGTTFERSKFT